MSDPMQEALAAVSEKLGGMEIPGSVKFDLSGLGAIVLDSKGARLGDDETDVTLSADAELFKSILTGEASATSAFMSGGLKIDGDMGLAMKLASYF